MQKQSLRSLITSKLSLGPRKVSDIAMELSLENKVTVQGVYKALRLLKKEEVVTVHRHTASLSVIWISEQIEIMERAATGYTLNKYLQELQSGNRQRAKFAFTTLNELDLFWTHSYLVVQEATPKEEPLYTFVPHDWFFYSRVNTDSAWMKKLLQQKRTARAIITHAQKLDKIVTKRRKETLDKSLQYVFNENPLKQQETEYYNMIGSWIFIGKLDTKISNKLSSFIEQCPSMYFTKDERRFIDSIMNERGKFMLTIINSPTKAAAIKKKVLKYFE